MPQTIALRIRKFFNNPLLNRRQFQIEAFHEQDEDISKKKIQAQIAKKFNTDPQLIVIFGQRTVFGGCKTTGFGLIYSNMDSLKKFEPKH